MLNKKRENIFKKKKKEEEVSADMIHECKQLSTFFHKNL